MTNDASEAGHGNCVIFRDDGGCNRQYMTHDGTWTVDRSKAARYLGQGEADELAKQHGVTFFGSRPGRPTCDILCFRFPDDYKRWLHGSGREIDADDAKTTQTFIDADVASCVPDETARALLRAARRSGLADQDNADEIG